MVNERQKAHAYSIQSFFVCRFLVGYIFPFFFTFLGLSNVAEKGVVPDSVIWSFYIGAAILILCVIYTTAKVKEMPPSQYAEYHGLDKPLDEEKVNIFKLLKDAPSTFWSVGVVQFFGWAAFVIWTYTNGLLRDVLGLYRSNVVWISGSRQLGGVLFAVQAIGSVCLGCCHSLLQKP